jgi:two-component system, sensor histidine kinase
MDIIKKILIVDDKPENIVALEVLLKDFDAQIIKATSGNEALTKTLEHDFALALIDVQMPDMDGYETVKLMRKIERTRFLPVIFLSAIYSEDHYQIQGIEAGAVDFITKPLNPRILLGKVRTFLELFEQKKKLEIEIEQRKQTEISLRETEKQLLLAKARAEESDRLKTAFLANMSHEIRTPLNAIVGFANLLAQPNIEPEKKQQYSHYVYNSSETLLTIISDILDIAKIEAGQLSMNKTLVNVSNVLTELLDAFREELIKKGKDNIRLSLSMPQDHLNHTLVADEGRFRQVVSNLLQNAIKFTLQGSIIFGYQLKNNVFEFFVRDTGIGIAKDNLEVIFNRFQKLQNDQIRNSSGTGLGLSIVKKILEMLGGSISVFSQVDKGTQFVFTLPAHVDSVQYQDEIQNDTGISPELLNWSSKNILIAEDEYSNYLLLEAILTPTRAKIKWAKNGKEAVESYKQNTKFDAVLMDIKMPVMTGYEAYAELRKLNKQLPIIAQTAYAMTGEKEQFKKIGFNGYLTKPVIKKELLKLLMSFLA